MTHASDYMIRSNNINPFFFFCDRTNFRPDQTSLCPDPDLEPDSESMSKSRRGIEEKLVEEYRNGQHFKETKAELGGCQKKASVFIDF